MTYVIKFIVYYVTWFIILNDVQESFKKLYFLFNADHNFYIDRHRRRFYRFFLCLFDFKFHGYSKFGDYVFILYLQILKQSLLAESLLLLSFMENNRQNARPVMQRLQIFVWICVKESTVESAETVQMVIVPVKQVMSMLQIFAWICVKKSTVE